MKVSSQRAGRSPSSDRCALRRTPPCATMSRPEAQPLPLRRRRLINTSTSSLTISTASAHPTRCCSADESYKGWSWRPDPGNGVPGLGARIHALAVLACAVQRSTSHRGINRIRINTLSAHRATPAGSTTATGADPSLAPRCGALRPRTVVSGRCRCCDCTSACISERRACFFSPDPAEQR